MKTQTRWITLQVIAKPSDMRGSQNPKAWKSRGTGGVPLVGIKVHSLSKFVHCEESPTWERSKRRLA